MFHYQHDPSGSQLYCSEWLKNTVLLESRQSIKNVTSSNKPVNSYSDKGNGRHNVMFACFSAFPCILHACKKKKLEGLGTRLVTPLTSPYSTHCLERLCGAYMFVDAAYRFIRMRIVCESPLYRVYMYKSTRLRHKIVMPHLNIHLRSGNYSRTTHKVCHYTIIYLHI